MGQYSAESGIKVLDRAVVIIDSVSRGDKTLAELTADTGIPRATAHRLATALEVHQILSRTPSGAWTLGPALARFQASRPNRLIAAAAPVMTALVDACGESVQLYRLTGTTRTCIAAQEPPSGLQNTVPVGSRLPLTHGSAARVFAAYSGHSLADAPFAPDELAQVRRTGVAESVAEREVGLASVSAPVFVDKHLVAVLSVSGPAERLRPSPAARWGAQLRAAATDLGAAL